MKTKTKNENQKPVTEKRYLKRGVSASKEDVHKAIKKHYKGLFPKAFCKIIEDYITKNPEYCAIMHADGAGTKFALAYLYWKITGEISVFKGVVQDSIVMNLDDVLCAGVTNEMIHLSSTLGRNKHLLPAEVVDAIINGANEFIDLMKQYDVNIVNTGGETADVGDLVRTGILDNTVFVHMRRDDVITNEEIREGDRIIGLASFGQTTYETEYNGGMGSNGLTSSRHDIFCKENMKYTETFDPNTDPEVIYCGQHKVTSKVPTKWFKNHPYKRPKNMGKLVLSPTRTYAPFIRAMREIISKSRIHGMIHCSGGAQTKVLNYIENLHIIKNNLFPTPPLFQIIQADSGTEWPEMYKVFNMGHRFEIYVPDDGETAQTIIELAKSFNLEARIIGHVEASESKKLTIKSEHGKFVYE